jgi:hypothetical protein
VHGWLYPMEHYHEHNNTLHDVLNTLDTSSHCDATGGRISGRHVLPREGLRQVEKVLDFILVEPKIWK